MQPATLNPDVGLCSVCRHVVPTTTDRGSTFYRCGRAKTDPSYPKYPRLPVFRCRGFEAPDQSAGGATL